MKAHALAVESSLASPHGLGLASRRAVYGAGVLARIAKAAGSSPRTPREC